jgi:tRNA-Thr(GGU) m(6)t(6)A37 methyltransferase TsaA
MLTVRFSLPEASMKRLAIALCCLGLLGCGAQPVHPEEAEDVLEQTYTLYPIGKVVKEEGRTFIVLKEEYEPALLGLERSSSVLVLYWFDRNDTPEKRSILQVHPQGNRDKPMRGVFATHAPVRPNLIAVSRCKIISVKGNVIEIDRIDAFPDSPVLDLKS